MRNHRQNKAESAIPVSIFLTSSFFHYSLMTPKPKGSTVKTIITFIAFIVLISLSGCGNERLEKAEVKYHNEMSRIKLDMSMSEVEPIIKIVNSDLLLSDKVPDEAFKKDGSIFMVKYMACKYYNDNVITYDEFLPLLFKDDKLIGIGWLAIGGPFTTQRHQDVNNYGFGVGIGISHEIK